MVTYMRLPNGKSILEILGNPMLRTTVTGGIGSLILGLSLLNLKKIIIRRMDPYMSSGQF